MPRRERYFIPPMAMEGTTFTRLVERLAAAGRVIALDEGVQQLKEGRLAGHKVAITFDDGYIDNYTLARDVLQRVGVHASFFVPVTPIDKQLPYWWDHLFEVLKSEAVALFKWALQQPNPQPLQHALETAAVATNEPVGERCRRLVQALNNLGQRERHAFTEGLVGEFGSVRGDRLLMTWDEIRQMQKDGFAIGSHSVSHIPLTDLDFRTAKNEIVASSRLLRERLGQWPTGFCFPRGAFTADHSSLVREAGYDYAVTTCFGGNDAQADPFSLKRRNMSDYQGVRSRFPVAMHLFELSGCLDKFLAARRAG